MSRDVSAFGRPGAPGWSVFRRLLVVMFLGWFCFAMIHRGAGAGMGVRGRGLAISVGVLLAVGSLALALMLHRKRLPGAPVAYTAATAGGVALYALAPDRPTSAILFVACGFAASTYDMRRSAPAVLVAAVGLTSVALTDGRPTGELWTVVGLLGMYAGVRASAVRGAARQTEQRNLALAERAHIAREIHDILAHSLSAQLVHLEGARLLLVNGKSDEALERVERARGLARSGLEETRRALAALRGDVPPLDEALRALADEHRLAADTACEVTVSGEPGELSPEAGLAVIRTTQEALTNSRKHAPGACVDVALRYNGGWCELRVTDTGPAAGANGAGDTAASLTETGGGYGLVGMRERAELIGGTLEAGPREGGFQVMLRVPA